MLYVRVLTMSVISRRATVILGISGTFLLMFLVIFGAIWLTHTSSASLGNARARCEKGEHSLHKVIIQNNKVIPEHTSAKKCDKLIIVNQDDQNRLIAFGQHEH